LDYVGTLAPDKPVGAITAINPIVTNSAIY
jgi:hypothetical protein